MLTQSVLFVTTRFGLRAGKKEKEFNLYTINIPVKRSSKPDPCFIAQWDGASFKPRLVVNAGTEVLSSMAVRLVDVLLDCFVCIKQFYGQKFKCKITQQIKAIYSYRVCSYDH